MKHKYDYYESVKNEIVEYILVKIALDDISLYDYVGRKDFLYQYIIDNVSTEWFPYDYISQAKAEAYVTDNWNLLATVITEHGYSVSEVAEMLKDLRYADACIRNYVIWDVADDAIYEIEEETGISL